MRLCIVFLSLLLAPLLMAETPLETNNELEGGGLVMVRRPLPIETARPRIDRLTWSLLVADGGARALDAWSTRRMLKNICSSGVQIAGTSTCNYEQNLPGFIANSTAGIYTFDGAVWLSEFGTTRFLARHHHQRLARFVPLIDALSTTSFAVNNLTLSTGGNGAVAAVASNSTHKKNR